MLASLPFELLPRLCIDPLAAAAMRCVCVRFSKIPADLFITSTIGLYEIQARSPYYSHRRVIKHLKNAGKYIIVLGKRPAIAFAHVNTLGWIRYCTDVSFYKRCNTYGRANNHKHYYPNGRSAQAGEAAQSGEPTGLVYAPGVTFTMPPRQLTEMRSIVLLPYKAACALAVKYGDMTVYKRAGKGTDH